MAVPLVRTAPKAAMSEPFSLRMVEGSGQFHAGLSGHRQLHRYFGFRNDRRYRRPGLVASARGLKVPIGAF